MLIVMILSLFLGAAGPAAAETAPADYVLTRTVALGAPDKWDYLVFDPSDRRLFIAHGGEVVVIDAVRGEILGRVGGLSGAHGIALVPGTRQGYASNNGQATLFDRDGLSKIADIPAGAGADAIVTDPASGRVFVMNAGGRDLTAIDPATHAVVGSVALDGRPEFAAADGKGALFVNIVDRNEILRVDTGAMRVQARWAIPSCEHPHGLAIDPESQRLFTGCANGRLLVVAADDGRIVGDLPIGMGSDAVAFDPNRKIIFSSNGEGTLSRIVEEGSDRFTALAPVVTRPGARTMAVDPVSGRVFLVTADPGNTPGVRFAPGTVTLLILDPR